MYFLKSLLPFAFSLLMISCSNSTNTRVPLPDAASRDTATPVQRDASTRLPDAATPGDLGITVSPDLARDLVPTIPDAPVVGGTDGPADLAPDTPLIQDTSQAGDLAIEVGKDGTQTDTSRACLWQVSGARYTLNHFRFQLTTPDGQEQSPPGTLGQDAGSSTIHDFEGRIASVEGNRFAVDSCLSPPSCAPTRYRFSLCTGPYGACKAEDLSPPLSTAIPAGRRVRIVWNMETDVPGFSPGLYWLVVYDAEPGTTKGNILFLGSGGYKPDPTRPAGTPLGKLPFSVSLRALGCGELGDARRYGDDYAFEFTPTNGGAAPLRLATGETGALDFLATSGSSQRLQIRCLDAVQPGTTDDYWNWDLWAINTSALAPTPDAGND